MSPEASLILISHIAPHTLNNRSIVLPEDARITVEAAPGHTGAGEGAEVVFDGDTSVHLDVGRYRGNPQIFQGNKTAEDQ